MSTEGLKDVGNKYYQAVLSGFGDFVQSTNQNGDSTQDEQNDTVTPPEFWQQKSYQILVPLIIKQTKLPDTKHSYEICITLDADIPLTPHRSKSKKLSGQVVNIPAEKKRDQSSIYLVYGMDEEGECSLSHTAQHTTQRDIAYITGRILGHIDRACQLLVHNAGREETPALDTGQHDQAAQAQENLGKPEKRERGKRVREQVRTQTPSEEGSVVVATDR